MALEKILIIDDEELVRNFIAETLERKDLEVETADCGKTGIKKLKASTFDMVITDLKMADLTGIEVLRKVKELSPRTIVVVITAYGTIENAVEAMKLGAFNYLIKPFSPDTIETVIDKANEHLSLVEENQYLREQVSIGERIGGQQVIVQSDQMKKIIDDAKRVAVSDSNVFITGESGTGKEVVAHVIHYHSNRAKNPYIKVNCAAMSETLIESEFFGHEKGAFTGANTKRLGRFELANGGTLLLDEITEIPLSLQAKLLRVIQDGVFERVGGTKSIKVDVRLISTSNRDVNQVVKESVLRNDLYYRLNVIPIHIPPLRERPDDIIPLVEYFLEKATIGNRKEIKIMTKEAKNKLLEYHWPGNVRELFNIVERAVVLNPGSSITPEDLHVETVTSTSSGKTNLPIGISLDELEKQLIIETLHAQKNDRKKTAKILGVSTGTLRNKLQQYHVD